MSERILETVSWNSNQKNCLQVLGLTSQSSTPVILRNRRIAHSASGLFTVPSFRDSARNDEEEARLRKDEIPRSGSK
jgi:hypothetical protein